MSLDKVFQLMSLMLMMRIFERISNPLPQFTTYEHNAEVETNVEDLWWTIDKNKKEILFEFHVKTAGWKALGISPDEKRY